MYTTIHTHTHHDGDGGGSTSSSCRCCYCDKKTNHTTILKVSVPFAYVDEIIQSYNTSY
uniref:Uncharacterized protein n=1 Tax=Octopus bimaculoides TaxID=37653 RepID=A0A0L8HPN6_OCTBM